MPAPTDKGPANPQNRPPRQRPDMQPQSVNYLHSNGQIRTDLLDAEAREFAKLFRATPSTA